MRFPLDSLLILTVEEGNDDASTRGRSITPPLALKISSQRDDSCQFSLHYRWKVDIASCLASTTKLRYEMEQPKRLNRNRVAAVNKK